MADHEILGLGAGDRYNFDDAVTSADMFDFQRSNLFTVSFATNPTAKSKDALSKLGNGDIYNMNNTSGDIMGLLNGSTSPDQFVSNIVRSSVNGALRFVVGAMTERLMSTLYGDLKVGTYVLDYFDLYYKESGLTIYSVTLPNNTLNYEIDKNHNAPNIKINGREISPLVLRFRVDRAAANLTAMNDWVNAVNDPVTQLNALPVDVEADIQVNLHARSGLPVTTMLYTGCVPVDITQPVLTYDERSEIAVFDVTFAYRHAQVGRVPLDVATEWILGDLGSVFGNKVFPRSRIK